MNPRYAQNLPVDGWRRTAPAGTLNSDENGSAEPAASEVHGGTRMDPASAEPLERSPEAPAGPTMGRRRFIRVLLGFSAVSMVAMIVTPVVGFLVPPKTAGAGTGGRVLVGTTADIAPGSAKVVAMGSSPVIVTNTESGVKAFSAVCTHLGCIVGFDDTIKQIVCPCHDGHFNPTSGAVLSGPPPQPLPPVTVAVEKDQIYLVQG